MRAGARGGGRTVSWGGGAGRGRGRRGGGLGGAWGWWWEEERQWRTSQRNNASEKGHPLLVTPARHRSRSPAAVTSPAAPRPAVLSAAGRAPGVRHFPDLPPTNPSPIPANPLCPVRAPSHPTRVRASPCHYDEYPQH